jgi:hypothetical protein
LTDSFFGRGNDTVQLNDSDLAAVTRCYLFGPLACGFDEGIDEDEESEPEKGHDPEYD